MKKIIILATLLLAGCDSLDGWELEKMAHNCGGVESIKSINPSGGGYSTSTGKCKDGRIYAIERQP